MPREIGIGLVGTGFMGKCHALAFAAVAAVFDLPLRPRLELLCDLDEMRVADAARQFGFARTTTDWRTLVADPAVDLVAIAAPNAMHRDIAMAAAGHGKDIYCEKPMALTLGDAEAMATAAAAAGAKTLVGYNYLHNPAIAHAKALVQAGELGRVFAFRGVYEEDYMADEATPYTWRCRIADAGTGALGDLASHLISVAHALVGPIVEVCADTAIAIAERPSATPGGQPCTVENEDVAAALVRFSNGATGMLSTSRSAWGRKNHLAWQLSGTGGALVFDQERMNELGLYRARTAAPTGAPSTPNPNQGFATILMGPAHPPYGAFVPAAGHGLGFNDLKVIEVAHLLAGLSGDQPLYPDFAAGLAVERVIHAIVRSAATKAWVATGNVAKAVA